MSTGGFIGTPLTRGLLIRAIFYDAALLPKTYIFSMVPIRNLHPTVPYYVFSTSLISPGRLVLVTYLPSRATMLCIPYSTPNIAGTFAGSNSTQCTIVPLEYFDPLHLRSPLWSNVVSHGNHCPLSLLTTFRSDYVGFSTIMHIN